MPALLFIAGKKILRVALVEPTGDAQRDKVSGNAADTACDHAAEHIGGVMHAQVDPRHAHEEREKESRPADFTPAAEKHGGGRRHRGGHVSGGEALVALGVTAQHDPVFFIYAALPGIGSRPRYKRLDREVGDQRSDGDGQQHGGAVTPCGTKHHQRERQQNEKDAALAHVGDQREKRREKAGRKLIKPVYGDGRPLVKPCEGGVEPKRGCCHFHKRTSVNHILTFAQRT